MSAIAPAAAFAEPRGPVGALPMLAGSSWAAVAMDPSGATSFLPTLPVSGQFAKKYSEKAADMAVTAIANLNAILKVETSEATATSLIL